MRSTSERGAVAVEFALLVPILVMTILGIMEFGRAYNVQLSLTSAAREGVRSMAINKDQNLAREAAKTAANHHLNPPLQDPDIAFSASSCTMDPKTGPSQMTVIISYNLSTMTGIAGPFVMTGKGTMLCGG